MDSDNTEMIARAFDQAWSIVESRHAQHIGDLEEARTLVAKRVLAAVYAGATSVEQLVENATAFFSADEAPAKRA